ncbi:MAG: NERD domain-containing protein [Planctomycetia bacterium]|nr:NERD domain-containing protein [Planctomycetia bacterium]
MARMLPDQYAEDPSSPSPAERRLFAAFRDQLPDDFTVFHSAAWHALNVRGDARDGEADFVIAHPELGILVVEAKSGGVEFDGEKGRWYAVGLGGRRGREMDNPVKQGARNKGTLVRLLTSLPAGRDRRWPAGWAVAFPDVTWDQRVAGLPEEVVLDRRGLRAIDAWVEAAMRHWQEKDRHQPMGDDGLAILKGLLAGGRKVEPVTGAQLEDIDAELLTLTENQFRTLDALADTPRALVCGCAGSGKTLLAVEKCRHLAAQGYRVLYACFNILLAEHVREALSGFPTATARHFHALCEEWAADAGVPLPAKGEPSYWEKDLPRALDAAARKLKDRRFDALVVDEGQDFRAHWWKPLELTLRDRQDGTFYVFYDDTQNLFHGQLALPHIATKFSLTENCRNLRRIHETAMRFYRGKLKPVCRARAGRQPEIRLYDSEPQLETAFATMLHKFVRDDAIPTRDVVVLSYRSAEKSALWRRRTFGGIALTDSPAPGKDEVRWTTIHKFKGLDAHAVILTELEANDPAVLRPIAYVGASRAKSQLGIVMKRGAAGVLGVE